MRGDSEAHAPGLQLAELVVVIVELGLKSKRLLVELQNRQNVLDE